MAEGAKTVKKVSIVFEAIDKITEKMDKISNKNKTLMDQLKDLKRSVKDAFNSPVARDIGGIASSVADFAKTAVDFTMDMVNVKEASIKVFAALTGGTANGVQAFDEVLEIAQKLKMSPKDALQGVQGMMAAGFKYNEALALFLSAESYARFNPAAKVDAIVKGFENIKNAAGGLLNMEGITQLGKEAGLGVDNLMKAIGEAKGMDTNAKGFNTKLEDMIKAGKVTADEGMAAISTSMSKRAGDAPGAFGSAAAVDDSFAALIKGIKSAPEQYILRMSMDSGPVKNALKQINAALDPTSETGKKVAAALGSAAGKIGELLSSMAKPENIKIFIDSIVGLIEVIPTLVTGFVAIARGAAWVFGAIQQVWLDAKVVYTAIVEMIQDYVLMSLQAYNKIVGVFGGKKIDIDMVMRVVMPGQSKPADPMSNPAHKNTKRDMLPVPVVPDIFPGRPVDSAATKAAGMAAGGWYAEGWGAGMAGAPGVTAGATALVAKADAATRSAAEIKSPSKKAMKTGAFYGEGFGMGAVKGLDDFDLGASLGSVLSAVTTAPPGAGGSAASSVNVGGITITIDGAGKDSGAIARDVGDEVRRLFENMVMA